MNDIPIELDRHRGMAAQKATDIRRVLADVEANAKLLRDKQGVVEIQLLAVPAESWSEAVASAAVRGAAISANDLSAARKRSRSCGLRTSTKATRKPGVRHFDRVEM